MGAQATLIMLLPQHGPSTFVQLVNNPLHRFVYRFIVERFVGILENHTNGITFLIRWKFIPVVHIKKEYID